MKREHYRLGEADIMERESQLQRFYNDIERLKSESDKTTSNVKPLSSDQIEALRRKYETAHSSFQQLKSAKDDSSWEQLKQRMEDAWTDLSDTLKSALK